MSESPKFIVMVAIGIFFLASAIAWGLFATTNPYSGANLASAALVSCPIYLMGVLAAIRYLHLISYRSFWGWLVFSLNLIPFGFTALLVGIGVTGNW